MSNARAVMDAAEYQQAQYKAMSEREFQNRVVRIAKDAGYRVYHTYNSRKSEPGFPDLVCVPEYDTHRPTIVAELKRETGKPSKAQEFWLDRLDCGEALEDYIIVRLWKPSDLPTIHALFAFNQRKEHTT